MEPPEAHQTEDGLVTPLGDGRCLYVGPQTTREDLLAAGVSPEATDELLAWREMLARRRR